MSILPSLLWLSNELLLTSPECSTSAFNEVPKNGMYNISSVPDDFLFRLTGTVSPINENITNSDEKPLIFEMGKINVGGNFTPFLGLEITNYDKDLQVSAVTVTYFNNEFVFTLISGNITNLIFPFYMSQSHFGLADQIRNTILISEEDRLKFTKIVASGPTVIKIENKTSVISNVIVCDFQKMLPKASVSLQRFDLKVLYTCSFAGPVFEEVAVLWFKDNVAMPHENVLGPENRVDKVSGIRITWSSIFLDWSKPRRYCRNLAKYTCTGTLTRTENNATQTFNLDSFLFDISDKQIISYTPLNVTPFGFELARNSSDPLRHFSLNKNCNAFTLRTKDLIYRTCTVRAVYVMSAKNNSLPSSGTCQIHHDGVAHTFKLNICGEGKMLSKIHAHPCVLCPAGRWSDVGSNFVCYNRSSLCPANYYGYYITCTSCPLSHVSPANAVNGSSCRKVTNTCQQGEFGVGDNCTFCPPEYSSAEGRAVKVEDCFYDNEEVCYGDKCFMSEELRAPAFAMKFVIHPIFIMIVSNIVFMGIVYAVIVCYR